LDGNGLSVIPGDAPDDGLSAGLASRVIDNDRRTFGGKVFSDGGANPLGGSSDNGDSSCEFAHDIAISFDDSIAIS
jgi:hypothetical protein